MGENSPTESSRNLLDVGIIAVLTIAANHLLPVAYHTETTNVLPFVGGGMAWAIRRLRKSRSHKQLVALETKWLNEAIAERAKPGLTRKKQEELDADIAERRRGLQELQRANLKVQ